MFYVFVAQLKQALKVRFKKTKHTLTLKTEKKK